MFNVILLMPAALSRSLAGLQMFMRMSLPLLCLVSPPPLAAFYFYFYFYSLVSKHSRRINTTSIIDTAGARMTKSHMEDLDSLSP